MSVIKTFFDERLQEIDAYLSLLEALEAEARSGPPKIGAIAVSSAQQKILYSSAYLQLYNLVEGTITWCLNSVAAAVCSGTRCLPADLSSPMRKEWVRSTARTHIELNFNNRLQTTLEFFETVISGRPLGVLEIEKGGGGNWDDVQIEDMSERIGCNLAVSGTVRSNVKRKIRDDKGALELVKYLRNRLAHGELSFAECGDGVTSADLKDLRDRTALYLAEVVTAYTKFVSDYEYLVPARRPTAPAVPAATTPNVGAC